MRLLIIEDEEDLANALAKGLRREGYAVDLAYDGEVGCEEAELNEYDLVLLDLTLPGLDGIEVCRRLRETRPSTFVLMLTARGDVEERIQGLDAGADDYLAKPFHFEEVAARVRAMLRRDIRARSGLLRCGDVTLDPKTHAVCLRSKSLHLTAKEFAILEYLLRNRDRTVSQEEILEHVWDGSVNSFTNVVRVHVRSLREKLGDDAESPRYIETVVGMGYRMVTPCPDEQEVARR
jgi:two-component system OmpR family response regulator